MALFPFVHLDQHSLKAPRKALCDLSCSLSLSSLISLTALSKLSFNQTSFLFLISFTFSPIYSFLPQSFPFPVILPLFLYLFNQFPLVFYIATQHHFFPHEILHRVQKLPLYSSIILHTSLPKNSKQFSFHMYFGNKLKNIYLFYSAINIPQVLRLKFCLIL